MSSRLKLLAFAGARDVVGAHEVDWPLAEPCTVAELFDAICLRFTGLSAHRSSLRIAVNGTYASDDALVRPGDEVALIPPVAGG